MSIIDTLVIDRTNGDVALRNEKGTYNATDMNRVSDAVDFVADELTDLYNNRKAYAKDKCVAWEEEWLPYPLPEPIVRAEIDHAPIKEYETHTETVTEERTQRLNGSNVEQYFSVSNGTYAFANNGEEWVSNNKNQKSTTAETTFTAKDAIVFSFSYSYSSEAKYDKFTLIVGGTTIESGVSGATTVKQYSGTLEIGQTIVVRYVKDSSNDSNDDECKLFNFDRHYTTNYEKEVTVETEKPDPTPPTMWNYRDIPNVDQLETYLDNVYKLRHLGTSTSRLPYSMEHLSYVGADEIERFLLNVHDDVQHNFNRVTTIVDNVNSAFFYSNEIFGGEV